MVPPSRFFPLPIYSLKNLGHLSFVLECLCAIISHHPWSSVFPINWLYLQISLYLGLDFVPKKKISEVVSGVCSSETHNNWLSVALVAMDAKIDQLIRNASTLYLVRSSGDQLLCLLWVPQCWYLEFCIPGNHSIPGKPSQLVTLGEVPCSQEVILPITSPSLCHTRQRTQRPSVVTDQRMQG